MALLDIADAVPQDWAVIGAQMVLLHALERGVQPPRFSSDVDVLVNARVVSGRIAGFVDDAPANQRSDLALLLTMVEDPFELAPQLTPKDRQRLRKRRELLDPTHDAWRGIDRAADGAAALRVLIARDT